MRDFTISVEIAAPPSAVWRVMSDVERWPEWTSSVTSVRITPPAPVGIGTRATIKQPKFPPAFWRVTEVEPNRHFTWVSSAPGMQVVARHSIEPIPSGSRITLALRFNGFLGGMWGRMTSGINRRYLELEANGLKRRVESEGRSV